MARRLVAAKGMRARRGYSLAGPTAMGSLALAALLSACGGTSKPVAYRGPATTASHPTSSVPATIIPPSTLAGSAATLWPATSSLPTSEPPVLPIRLHPGEPPPRCSIGRSLLEPENAAPGTSPSELAPFIFPPPDAAGEDRPLTDSDIAGFITAFRAFTGIPARVTLVVVPGSARGAYIPSNGQHWGLASFSLPPGVSVDRNLTGNNLDPPYNMLAFVQPRGCPWDFRGPLAVPFPCPNARDIPVGVQKAWGLPSPPKDACANFLRQKQSR